MGAESKVILLTGASKGIGHAIAKFLINEPAQHRVVLVSRTAKPLEQLKSSAPDRVAVYAGDMSDQSTVTAATKLAISHFGKLDGLILNHGTLGEVGRVSESTVQGWVETFHINFFSYVAAVKAAIPELRKTKGRIIMTSSGAATGATTAWGAYGATKAAVNHLAMTVSVEEPDITTVAIRPGMVDTDMQRQIREDHGTTMAEKDHQKFMNVHTDGKLVRPEQSGHVIARLAIEAPEDLSGQFLTWNDKALAKFQDGS